jgi:hypothetical protein
MPHYQTALPGMQLLQQHQTSPARQMTSASIQDTSARMAMPPLSHIIRSPQHHGSQQGHGTHHQSVSHQHLSSMPHQQTASIKQQQPSATHPMQPDSSHLSSSHHGGSLQHHGTQPLGPRYHGGGYSDSQPLTQPAGSQDTHPLGPSHHGGGYSDLQPLAQSTGSHHYGCSLQHHGSHQLGYSQPLAQPKGSHHHDGALQHHVSQQLDPSHHDGAPSSATP